MAQMENSSILEDIFENELRIHDDRGSPVEATASTRLGDDICALSSLFSPLTVLEVYLRSKQGDCNCDRWF